MGKVPELIPCRHHPLGVGNSNIISQRYSATASTVLTTMPTSYKASKFYVQVMTKTVLADIKLVILCKTKPL